MANCILITTRGLAIAECMSFLCGSKKIQFFDRHQTLGMELTEESRFQDVNTRRTIEEKQLTV